MSKNRQSIFKEIFILRQVTPMIHFQWDQEGATVRATEMKPKFDHFIFSLANECDFTNLKSKLSEEVFNCLLAIKEQTEFSEEMLLPTEDESASFSLNYKMRIYTQFENQPDKNEDSQSFPVDSVNRKGIEKGIGAYFFTGKHAKSSFHYKVKVEILCFQKALKTMLKELFPMFIAVTNFGFRQNKGFGHFVVENGEKTNEDDLVMQCVKLNSRYFLYEIHCNNPVDYKIALEIINEYNQRLKSGFNIRNKSGERIGKPYVKSFIMKNYIRDCINEKRFMKDVIMRDCHVTLKGSKEKIDELSDLDRIKVKYVRGILGFANHYEFQKLRGGKFKVKLSYEIENQSKESETNYRFASPITYIPVLSSKNENKIKSVYVLIDEQKINDVQNMNFKVNFDFSDGIKEDVSYVKPLINNFNARDFFDKAATQINKDKKNERKKEKSYKFGLFEIREVGM